ncbi:MAG: AAA family ATPase, partial [Prochloron sp. SP5CPC1]|nr:AAA family ATPase [Candidatus Paraprochloron terpiosi SP5CPC1]
MVNPTNYLLIVSTEAYSGKSATILGIAHQLQERGIAISYGKLLGTFISKDSKGAIEEDVRFIAATLNLGRDRVKMPLLYLNEDTILKRLQGEDSTDYSGTLKDYCQDGGSDLVLLEGAGTLAEGSLFNLSAVQIAQQLNASILLVARYSSLFLVDSLLGAKQYLGAFAGKGSPLLGVSINDIPLDKLEAT